MSRLKDYSDRTNRRGSSPGQSQRLAPVARQGAQLLQPSRRRMAASMPRCGFKKACGYRRPSAKWWIEGQRTFWTIRSQEGAWGGWPLNQSNAGNLAPLCCFTGRGAGRAPGINATRWKSLRRLGADRSSEVARLAGLAFGILSAYQIARLERGEYRRPIDPLVLLTKLKTHG
jgi:hypothetical protein